MQFCKVKIDNRFISPTVVSFELVLDVFEYLKFAQDPKHWYNIHNNGFTMYNNFYFININHDIKDGFVASIIKEIRPSLRENKLKLLLEN